MTDRFDPEKAIGILRELAEKATPEQRDALAFAITLAEFGTEKARFEDFNGQQTVIVELTEGYTYEQDGELVHCDVVRLRRPTIQDEWQADALAAEITQSERLNDVARDMCLVAQVVVDWKGLPMPNVREHLATLTRADASRLLASVYALEAHCEKLAVAGKSRRSTSSQSD